MGAKIIVVGGLAVLVASCGSSSTKKDDKQNKAGFSLDESSEQAAVDGLLAAVMSKTEGAVLDIECDMGDGTKARGTGTKIADNQIITAHHVVDKAQACLFRSNKAIIATGGSWDLAKSGRDIAIVDPKDLIGNSWSALPSIKPRIGFKPKVGQLLLLASLPENLTTDKQYTFGRVTDDQVNASLQAAEGHPGSWKNAFMSDMAAAGGSSGAPIFNAQGEFIGIHVGGYQKGLELNFQLAFAKNDFDWD
jgi:V8-like Glu-specific endopeptidase